MMDAHEFMTEARRLCEPARSETEGQCDSCILALVMDELTMSTARLLSDGNKNIRPSVSIEGSQVVGVIDSEDVDGEKYHGTVTSMKDYSLAT